MELMKFVRAIWKLLVGIKDALVLLFMLMFFWLLYAGLSAGRRRSATACSRSTSTASSSKSRRKAQLSELAGGSRMKEYRLRDLDRGARRGARRRPGQGGRARPRRLPRRRPGGDVDLSEALRRVRAAGKPVIAYAAGYANDSYQLGAAASEVWLNPLGAVRSPARAARTSISRGCSTSSE